MATKKRKTTKTKKANRKTDLTGKTAFIAMSRNWEKANWQLCGSDLHATANKARDCGCAETGDPDNVAVLEVTIVAQHQATVAYTKAPRVEIKYND